ncbi:hypothetical protein DV736_g2244, partial [Chaetothyriales sp. CBS 134916]
MPAEFSLWQFFSRVDDNRGAGDNDNGDGEPSHGLLGPEDSAVCSPRRKRQLTVWRWRHIRSLWLACVLLVLLWLGSDYGGYWPSPIHSGEQSLELNLDPAPHAPKPVHPAQLPADNEDEADSDDYWYDDGEIPIGQSRDRGGREVFWWEQFPRLHGLFRGRNRIVPLSEYTPEQYSPAPFEPNTPTNASFQPLPARVDHETKQCYLDQDEQITVPIWGTYLGQPRGMSAPLFGSHEELGLDLGRCYDRLSRFGAYGIADLAVPGGDNADRYPYTAVDWDQVNWASAQEKCSAKNSGTYTTRTAVIIRTWHSHKYSKWDIAVLRALIAELALQTGGEYTVHFLVHVQNDTIPIWASDDEYQRVLNESLPREFRGMATLWSVAQMMLVYPGPFPDTIVNFSGGELYEAYRSLHFPLQYFAARHPEFDYFWQWEMDLRVTGHYHELFRQITDWAQAQPRHLAWERSSRFFIPELYNNSYQNFAHAVEDEVLASGRPPISGPQAARAKLLEIPHQASLTNGSNIVDLITLNPLFDPKGTAWAFHDDITGYVDGRPPTRAALITASRLSRRLLLLMHEETYRKKHTMFPEMFPASVALQYGLNAMYAPLPVYFDRDWPAVHANEIFNNAPVSEESKAHGLIHKQGYFHGPHGSVFGPGEHVFRGSTYYSNAGFASYLWRRWLGHENDNGEIAQEIDQDDRGRIELGLSYRKERIYDRPLRSPTQHAKTAVTLAADGMNHSLLIQFMTGQSGQARLGFDDIQFKAQVVKENGVSIR